LAKPVYLQNTVEIIEGDLSLQNPLFVKPVNYRVKHAPEGEAGRFKTSRDLVYILETVFEAAQ
jgi:hypothetical protein